MKLGKVLAATVAVTVFNVVMGMVTCGGIFNWVYKLEPTSVWRPMAGAPPASFFIGEVVVSLLFVIVYALLANGIPGKGAVAKGIVYGLCIWAVGIVPGMFATYAFMTVATTVVVYWTLSALVLIPLKGIIAAAIMASSCPCCCSAAKPE